MSKKKLDIEEIAGELSQSPLSNNPLKGSVFFDKKPLDKVEKKEHDEDMENERTNDRTDAQRERTNERSKIRATKRYSFEFYTDQVEKLKKISLQDQLDGKKTTMSDIVRDAIDYWIKKIERTNG